jgi:hypothetical protein
LKENWWWLGMGGYLDHPWTSLCTQPLRQSESLWFICIHSIHANAIEHNFIKWPRNVYFTSILMEDACVAEFYLFVLMRKPSSLMKSITAPSGQMQ